MLIKKHLDLLGLKAEDKITGFSGIVDCISFDLYGCVQASIKPPMDDKGKMQTSFWFDVSRLEINSKKPIMVVPNFIYGTQAEGKQGPADKACRMDQES